MNLFDEIKKAKQIVEESDRQVLDMLDICIGRLKSVSKRSSSMGLFYRQKRIMSALKSELCNFNSIRHFYITINSSFGILPAGYMPCNVQ